MFRVKDNKLYKALCGLLLQCCDGIVSGYNFHFNHPLY